MSKIFNQMMFPAVEGMGDSLVITGIVRHFASICERIYVPTTVACLPTLTTLYSNQPNIQLLPTVDPEPLKQLVQDQKLVVINPMDMHATWINGRWRTLLWDEQWYTFYQLPFHTRYTGFNLPHQLPGSTKLAAQLVTHPEYILTHTEIGTRPGEFLPIDMHSWRAQAGLAPIDQFQIININKDLSPNMMDYVDLIRNASEIHCVPSSFFCLVDSINSQTEAKLFWHDLREDTVMRINNRYNNNRWCVIHYDTKY